MHSVWSYISGYFDGDGSVDVDARAHTLHWVLSFSDNWIEQVRWVKQLLEGEGITVGKSRRTGVGAWKVEVAGIESLKKMAAQMLNSGGLHKKKREIKLIIDYYIDKITGVEASEVLNREVREGIRIGKMRHFAIPYTYLQGMKRWANGSRSGGLLTDEVKRNLLKDHVELGLNGRELGVKYGVSRTTAWRVIRGFRDSIPQHSSHPM
ncbi:MAG TPA: LAGLIDADG family homing endonuclease [Nitrososphaerales archaeon]|nr:LAGLIDADG family homing endonuclease [Nitrososphaerales archaeon]